MTSNLPPAVPSLSTLPSCVLNAELLCRAYNRAEKSIAAMEESLRGARAKQARRRAEMIRQMTRTSPEVPHA